MSHSRCALFVFAFLFATPTLALACLWDYDTVKQEMARFPTTLELITGEFPRHTRELYEWRIRERLARLKAEPTNLEYLDDLAVAYEKTGEHDKAIATMQAKEKIKPGLYETYSNLGTFHILAGEFELGLPYIDKALAINPDAHFGRERYQKWLVEYAMTKRGDGQLSFPLSSANRSDDGFHLYVAKQLNHATLPLDEQRAAVKGVLGMMRFANHENPLLLEALGDLLGSSESDDIDAKQLAARAYLKASYVVEDETAEQAYRQLAKQVLGTHPVRESDSEESWLATVEREFAAELASADQWYPRLAEEERGWIRDGKNPDVEFDRRYARRVERPLYRRPAAIVAAAAIFGILVVLYFRSLQ